MREEDEGEPKEVGQFLVSRRLRRFHRGSREARVRRSSCSVRFIAVLVVAACVLLLAPAAATASHSGYWFFRGWLPTGDGTRTVHHEVVCCDWVNALRMSWECNTHDMNFVFIRYNGSWDFANAPWYDCDTYIFFSAEHHARGGCQNPPRPGYYTVWTNCRIGLTVY
jgi:hypothetical protein